MQPRGRLSPTGSNESVKRRNKKAACSQAALCKEAKEEGKFLRKGDARCSPGLRQDTRIEEVSILGRGLKSCLVLRASLFVSYTSNSETKYSKYPMWNTRQQLNLLFCYAYTGFQREKARIGGADLRALGLFHVVSEYQH